jgi:hypothetical protein
MGPCRKLVRTDFPASSSSPHDSPSSFRTSK